MIRLLALLAIGVSSGALAANLARADDLSRSWPAGLPTEAVQRAARPQAHPPRAAVRSPAPDAWTRARGPIEIRDEWILAGPRLTLPAVSPDVLQPRRFHAELWLDRGNDFGFDQSGLEGQIGFDRRFMIDGEHQAIEGRFRYGLGRAVDVGLRVPVRWRGGGVLDPLIEWWHDTFGLKNNSREDFPQDRYLVAGRDDALTEVEWEDEGWGLGNVELDARWAVLRARHPSDWRAALIARVGLPTATGPFETGSVDVGFQVVVAKRIHRRVDLYGGVGGTYFSEDTIDGIRYEPWRGQAFVAVEWRVLSWASLLVQTDIASRLVDDLTDYPAVQWYLQTGAKVDLGRGWTFTLGLTENLLDQQSTVDVGFWAGLGVTL